MRRNIIILANSRKRGYGNRCIAGIDVKSGEWVRPCFGTGENGIPFEVRRVDDEEPQLLDILSIPLENDGPHRDIQPENRRLSEGAWEKVDVATIKQVLKYKKISGWIFHNTDRKIHINEWRRVHENSRKSLCLIKTNAVFTAGTSRGKRKVYAAFKHHGIQYSGIIVTDYEFEYNFKKCSRYETECLLTLSLTLPFRVDDCCYKLVAGVILL